MKFEVTIEATIRKVILVEEPTGDRQKAIEIAHESFTPDNDGTEERYEERCLGVVESGSEDLAVNEYPNANEQDEDNTVPYLCDDITWDAGGPVTRARVFVPAELHLARGLDEEPLEEFIGRVLSAAVGQDPDDCTFNYNPEFRGE